MESQRSEPLLCQMPGSTATVWLHGSCAEPARPLLHSHRRGTLARQKQLPSPASVVPRKAREPWRMLSRGGQWEEKEPGPGEQLNFNYGWPSTITNLLCYLGQNLAFLGFAVLIPTIVKVLPELMPSQADSYQTFRILASYRWRALSITTQRDKCPHSAVVVLSMRAAPNVEPDDVYLHLRCPLEKAEVVIIL